MEKEKESGKLGLGIDLGTANLLVFLEQKGIIFNEPSVIAFDRESGKVIAAGKDAYKMIGKVHSKISIIKPLRDGGISDLNAAKELLTYVLKKVEDLTEKSLGKSTTVICCPSEVTKIEQNVMIDLAREMNMSDVFIEEEIKAGALGAGLNIFQSKGIMIVDIGGGTTDVGVISYGDIVLSRSIRMAGTYMTNEITKYVKKTRNVEIGELTAERCKMELVNLNTDAETVVEKFAGRDMVKGIPKWVEISSDEVRKVLEPVFEEIVKLIAAVLKDTSPELSADIFRSGIYVTGGGALTTGIETFIKKRIPVPVTVISNPLTCVAEGLKYLLKNRGDYRINSIQM